MPSVADSLPLTGIGSRRPRPRSAPCAPAATASVGETVNAGFHMRLTKAAVDASAQRGRSLLPVFPSPVLIARRMAKFLKPSMLYAAKLARAAPLKPEGLDKRLAQ